MTMSTVNPPQIPLRIARMPGASVRREPRRSAERTSASCLPALAALALSVAAACGKPSSGAMLPPPTENPPTSYVAGMTWYKDVQPIVQARCQGCHTAGGIAPFALSSYDLTKQYAAAVSSAVEARRMPPWMPDPSCQSFADSRRLEQGQVDAIVSWVKDGSPLGDPRDEKPAPMPPQGLSQPSVTLDIGGSYTPTASPIDDYHCFVADPKLTQDRDLVAYEFMPDQRAEVHHVLIYAAQASAVQAADDAAPGLGWPCGGGPGVKVDGLVAAWVPGSPATYYPSGTGVPIAAGRVLAIQIHYNTVNGALPDRSSLRLKYADQPVARRAVITPLSEQTFAIPPTSQGYSTDALGQALKGPVTLWGLAPHMHTLGRSVRVEADGQCLIYIPRWDFHWQQLYFTSAPTGIPLAAGTVPKLTCVWDNPTAGTVRWGEGTSDEMCINYFYVTSP